MRTFLVLVLSVLCFLLAALPLRAEETQADSSRGWLYAGWMTIGGGPGWNFARNVNYVGFTVMGRPGYAVSLHSAVSDYGGYDRVLGDVSLLLGKRFDVSPNAFVVASLGPALVHTRVNRGPYGYYGNSRYTGGLSGEFGLILPLMIRYGGVGCSVLGNINPDHSYAALTVNLHIGYVR